MKKLIISAGVVALVAACASAPQRSEQLEQARAQVQTLSADPLAQQAAATDIEAARATLQQADTALQQKKPPEQVNQYAYLALRHAQAGEARVAEAHSRQESARGEQDRNRVVMQTRERETQHAQSELAGARQELLALQAKQTDRGLVMTLSDVLFDTGRSTLNPGADRDLDRLAQALKDNSNTRVMIEGHTDSVGSDSYNEELSQRRAQAVADALRTRGVASDRYESKGLGKSFPVASNSTAAGRQQNRRVEIVFSDDAGRFAQGSSQSSSSR